MYQESGPAQGFTRDPGCASPLPTPDSCFTAPCHPRASTLLLSLLFPTSHQPHGSQNAACRPIFPVIFLAQHALTERLKLTLTPLVTQQPSVETGLKRSQSFLALAGCFPERPGQARSAENLPAAGRSCAALPGCGSAAGERADQGRFCARRFCVVSEAQGPAERGARGRLFGHTITPTLPSSLPLGDVQLTALSPASRARRPGSGCIAPQFGSLPLLPAPKVTSCLPQLWGPSTLLAQGHGAACLPASVPKQMEDISSLLHPSRIICLAGFLSGTPLLTASKSPVLPCLFPDPSPHPESLVTCLSLASIFPKAIPPYPCRMP